MNKKVFLLIWAGFLVYGLAADQAARNEQLIEKIFFRILDSLKVSKQFDSTGVYVQFDKLDPEKRSFCRSRLIKYFSQKKIAVSEKKQGRLLVIQQFDPVVEYYEPAAEILGFSGQIKRRVLLRFRGWTGSPSAAVPNLFWEMESDTMDVIDRGQIERVEQSPYTFTRGKWVSYSTWTRFLEPFIIIGSVTILIFLFYSLRT
ncbi:MAG: hypothetical protein GXO77_03270 [Calditrichaeota bacterium]|nr:hypothetical protein [Calditrichota bacterium]